MRGLLSSGWFLSAVACGVVLTGSDASAETPSVAIGATISSVLDERSERFADTTNAVGFNVEVFISPRKAIALEVDAPQTRAYDGTSRTSRADGSTDVWISNATFRDPTVAVTVGWHFHPRPRADIVVVTGGALERRVFTQSVRQETLDRSGTVVKRTEIDYPPDVFVWPEAVTGVDFAFAFNRFSLGPQFRLYIDPILYDGCCGGARAVARIAIRWSMK